jgi:hypothetical protein
MIKEGIEVLFVTPLLNIIRLWSDLQQVLPISIRIDLGSGYRAMLFAAKKEWYLFKHDLISVPISQLEKIEIRTT